MPHIKSFQRRSLISGSYTAADNQPHNDQKKTHTNPECTKTLTLYKQMTLVKMHNKKYTKSKKNTYVPTCAYRCAQLWYTLHHRTILFNLPHYP